MHGGELLVFYWMAFVTYEVNTLLLQFDQWSLAKFNQTVSKIGHTLKTVFYYLKSQGPLKHAKNIAEM